MNAQDQDGNTPLHAAARKGFSDVVELLLAHGADRDIKNNNGKTALMVARKHEHKKVIELLKPNESEQN